MSIRFISKDLTPAEVSFLKWQYGFEDEDDPFERSLWHTIMRAWEADNDSPRPGRGASRHLNRLGSADAYPDEVALYVKFKSDQSDRFWRELIDRAGLTDRRQRQVATPTERRRRAEGRR
jgi:hypothetical protein